MTQIRDLHDNMLALRMTAPEGTKLIGRAQPTTTAVQILARKDNRKGCRLFNRGSVTVFLGTDSSVTINTGYPLEPGAELPDPQSTDAWFGITASGTGDIRYLEYR